MGRGSEGHIPDPTGPTLGQDPFGPGLVDHSEKIPTTLVGLGVPVRTGV